MVGFVWRSWAFALAVIPSASAFANNTPDALQGPVQIVPFRFELASDNVGKAKLGIPCFPSRKLRWSQISKPSSAEVDSRVSDFLTGRGLQIAFTQSEPWRDASGVRIYLRGTLLAVNFNVCVPYLGVGEFRPRGEGVIEVRWEKLSSDGQLIDQRTVKQPLNIAGRDPRSDGSIVLDGVQGSVASFLFADSQP